MISAVQYGKASIDLKEDTLTSTFFDNLLHLPNKLFWDIIKKSCYENSLPCSINSIESIEYWPRWNSENTEKDCIIPDLFIRFDNFDLIIEAKRWENNQQYHEQWKNEFIGYKNEYEKDEKDVYLLAIGGIYKEDETPKPIKIEKYGSIKVVTCRWSKILETLVNIRNGLDESNIRITNTIISGLEMHGFLKIDWLESINKYDINFESSYKILSNWRIL